MLPNVRRELVSFSDPGNTSRLYGYDDAQRLNSVISKRGFPTTHSYGSPGQWTGSGFPDGASISAQISKSLGLADLGVGIGSFGNPAPHAPGGPVGVTCFVYDGEGNLTETTGGLGTITAQEYADPNCLGLVTKTTTAANRPGQKATTSFGYESLTCNLEKSLDAEGVGSKFERDDAGNVSARTESLGTVEEGRFNLVHDTQNRVTTWSDSIDGPTVWRYDAAGSPSMTGEDLSAIVCAPECRRLNRRFRTRRSGLVTKGKGTRGGAGGQGSDRRRDAEAAPPAGRGALLRPWRGLFCRRSGVIAQETSRRHQGRGCRNADLSGASAG